MTTLFAPLFLKSFHARFAISYHCAALLIFFDLRYLSFERRWWSFIFGDTRASLAVFPSMDITVIIFRLYSFSASRTPCAHTLSTAGISCRRNSRCRRIIKALISHAGRYSRHQGWRHFGMYTPLAGNASQKKWHWLFILLYAALIAPIFKSARLSAMRDERNEALTVLLSQRNTEDITSSYLVPVGFTYYFISLILPATNISYISFWYLRRVSQNGHWLMLGPPYSIYGHVD